MAKTTSTANWQTLDPQTLPTAIAKQYARYKEAYAEMKAERTSFETALAAVISVPSGSKLIFGYNFGKLSIAVVAAATKPAAKGALSLSDFLKAQAASGHRA